MASTKRGNPSTEKAELPESKRAKNAAHHDPSEPQDSLRVVLNPADCNLDFDIEGDGLTGHALYEQGFAYCWSGARGNIGIKGGKYCFGCKIFSAQPVKMEDTPLDQQNVCRIGISRGDDPVGSLGETEHSYGFGGTGKFSNASKFVEYGERFGFGDTIVCLIDLESKPLGSIEFSKNGRRLGIAKHFDAGPRGVGLVDSPAPKLPWAGALFPHVLLKNTVVELQFSIEDGLVPEEGYKPWASSVVDGKAVRGPSFSDPTDCEVMMMVGLPASGKTYWSENWVKEHPEKRYVLLGTNIALDQMKVQGLLRKNNYSERFDRLMDRATGIFNTLLVRASKVPRNFIIDQTNVYKGARKRKLKPFAVYNKIAVVVFPKPEELKFRAKKRFQEMGKEVPASAVNEMIANFVLPKSKDMHSTDEYFDQVIFTELSRVDAQRHLDEMKRAVMLASDGQPRSDFLTRFSETSHADCRVAAYSSSVPGDAYTVYSGPSSGVRGVAPGGSWRGPPMPNVLPYTANAHAGFTGQGPLGRVEPPPFYHTNVSAGYRVPEQPGRAAPYVGSYQERVNPLPSRDAYHGAYSSHNGPRPRDDLLRYGSNIHESHPRNDASHTSRIATEHMNYPEDAAASYQHSYGSVYGTSSPRPRINPVHLQRPGAAPYGYPPPRYH